MGGYQRGGEDLNYLSSGNTTETPLSSGATYTGSAEQNDFSQVGVMLKTDNTGTLYFDFSGDGANWDSTFPTNGYIIKSGVPSFHTAVKLGRFFRVRLVNDSGAQTYLRLYTYFGDSFIPSIAPLNQSMGLDSDAIMTRPSSISDEISLGRRSGVTPWNKFAYRSTLTAAGGEETIWAATGNFTPLTSAETFDISYNSTNDGAGVGATGATELTFYYIDSNGLPATATHTLGSDGTDTTSFSGLGINRVAVSASGSSTFNVNNITITATTAGTTQAFIPAGESVTQQAIFFTGSNHKAIGKFLYYRVNRLAGSNPKVIVKGYVFNRAIATRFQVYKEEIDTQTDNVVDITDPVGFKFNETDVLYFVADTDRDNTVIDFRVSLIEYQNT